MRVFLESLGCKLNQAEMEHMGRQLRAAGHQLVGSLSAAEMHILNTCHVTHVAARDSRKAARRGKRLDPGLRTVLTGCFVTGEPAAAAALDGVDLVVPNSDKDRLLQRLEARFPEMRRSGQGGSGLPVPCATLEFGNSRALVKVEDGCNMRCSFCIIPRLRGSQQSRPLPEVLAEVRRLVDDGYQEVVVTGVQISSYRWQSAGLFELARALLAESPVRRLRLTSIAPWQFDLRLLDLFSSARLCRHLHLSLQSGCERTLRRMRRPYSPRAFADLVAEVRSRVPGIAITTDVIVGFPGETEEDFEESLAFCRRLAFARLHAFPFSPRPDTEASALPDAVSDPTRSERMRRMLAVARRSRRDFETAHAHRRVEVLWEYRRQGLWHGTTDNYLHVVTDEADDLNHRITAARLEGPGDLGIRASLIGNTLGASGGAQPSPR